MKRVFLTLIIFITFIFFLSSQNESFGVDYLQNFFDEEDFKIIKEETYKLNELLTTEKNNIAVGRKGTTLPKENKITKLCNSEETRKKLRLPDAFKPSDTPVEYRVYPKGGQMDWHRDTVLYTKPQFEMVYTVDNTSDSLTQWYDPKNRTINEIQTEPNSLLIIKADDIQHRVTPVTKGQRSIIKFAYSETLEKTPDYFYNLSSY